MSAAELIYRAQGSLKHTVSRFLSRARDEKRISDRALGGFSRPVRNSLLTESHLATLSPATRDVFEELYPGRTSQIVRYAERGCAHLASFFDITGTELGDEINWHKDYKLGIIAPLRYGPRMDFRDPTVVGNVNYVWELNRHQQLTGIAKAYYLTGNERFAIECIRQITSWIESNPCLLGINWNSGLELGIRLISWLWVARFIMSSPSADESWWTRFLTSVWEQAQFIHDNYSAHSSANNHLVGEAAGVLLVSLCLPQLPDAADWQERSLGILRREICKQIGPDGVNKEQTTAYQTFTTMLAVLAGVVGERLGTSFGSQYWASIRASCAFLAQVTDCNGNLPNIGDATDSRPVVLDEEEPFPPYKSLVALGAILFEDDCLRSETAEFPEAAFWLMGRVGYDRFTAVRQKPLRQSALFPQGGYALLRRGRDQTDELSLLFDSGPLGYLSIAAHGHADALSFTLSAYGKKFFIDPGTYLYFVDRKWRNYFKGTAAHNTIRIDGLDQAHSAGDFVWLTHYTARIERWESKDNVDFVQGSHDGYRRLSDPVHCCRAITLHKASGFIEILDTVTAAHAHVVEQFFHLAAGCTLKRRFGSEWRIENDGSTLDVQFDSTTDIDVLEGSGEPILGWESLGYGRKHPSPTVRTTRSVTGTCMLRTYIRMPSALEA